MVDRELEVTVKFESASAGKAELAAAAGVWYLDEMFENNYFNVIHIIHKPCREKSSPR